VVVSAGAEEGSLSAHAGTEAEEDMEGWVSQGQGQIIVLKASKTSLMMRIIDRDQTGRGKVVVSSKQRIGDRLNFRVYHTKSAVNAATIPIALYEGGPRLLVYNRVIGQICD
jgi:hypothetical protein